MQSSSSKSILTALALAASAMALAACEVRRDGDGDTPEPTPTAEPTATPTPSPSATETETTSIMRDDLAPAEEVDEPAEPLEVTIPMPDGNEIDTRAERLLVDVLSSDAMDEAWPIIIAGHTDSTGNDQANLRSSRSRAEAVAAWLVEYGVDDSRIEVIAFGEQNPIAPNARPDGSPSEEGRRRNRRVELIIAPPPPAAGATRSPQASPTARATGQNAN